MIDMNKVWQQQQPGQAQTPQLGGAKTWEGWGPKTAPNVQTDWQRSPQWGAHVLHDPEKYGWQDYGNLLDLYRQGSDISSLTPQMGGDWREYYGDRKSGKERRQKQGLGRFAQPPADYSESFNQGQQQQQPDYTQQYQTGGGYPASKEPLTADQYGGGEKGRPIGDPQVGFEPWDMGQQQPYPDYSQQGGQFQYPWQMDTASNVLSNFAQGAPTQLPWQWGQGSDIAAQMGQTGMPTSYAPAYQASKGVVEKDIVSAIKQAGEEAGVEGLRYSSPMDAMSKRIAAEKMGQLGAQWTGQELGAQEAARGRQLQALPQMYQFGAGGAGLTESAKDRGFGAAQALGGLGQQYANLPMDWSQRMMGMGSQIYGQDQSALDRQYQDYMRMAPESNPYMNYGMQFMGQPSQMGYQQYQPSFFSSLLGMLPGLALGAGSMGLGLVGG